MIDAKRAARVPPDSPVARALFGDTRWAWIWLIVRVYLGWTWLSAGIEKLESPAWMAGGTALKSFWTKAVAMPAAPARPPITYGWYRTFIEALLNGGHYVWFAKFVAVGETLIGVALILGLFTGVAAFFAGFMNWNFLMAGTISTSPILLLLAILLVLAWRVAGWWGLDRWAFRLVGTPWSPGRIFRRRARSAAAA